MELSSETKNLVEEYKRWYNREINKEMKEPVIEVDEVASRVALFYEKVREVVDWKEEQLLRRSAIERILNRRMMFGEDEETARGLIVELVRGGHLPNKKIPEAKSKEVAKILKKYIYIIGKVKTSANGNQETAFSKWMISLMAVEVEDCLDCPRREKALINYMTEVMSERIKISSEWQRIEPSFEEKKKIFVFVATQKALFNLDDVVISYYLLEKFYSWASLSEDQFDDFSNRILDIKNKIERFLAHPLQEKIYNVCEEYDTAFLLVHDVLSKNPNKIEANLNNSSEIEGLVTEAYQSRFNRLKASLKRAAIYATASIFLSKMLLALAIEVPVDRYLGEFNYQTLGINVFFPPLLMAFLILSIRPPQKINLQRSLMEVMKLIYQNSKTESYLIRKPIKAGIILNSIIFGFYAFSFLISFGLIFWVLLEKLKFSLFSAIVFVIFISLISFVGIRLRQRAKELTIEEEKEGFLGTIKDILSLPILRFGKWLSHFLQKHNFLTVFFNVLIDTPFQAFVEFVEQLRYFIKEKKEEIK
ncbi:MAG: hypothetical protein Q8O39_01785 [bacterium]|nr:hypothetical protein [bacterium]